MTVPDLSAPYRLLRDGRFWTVHVAGASVTTRYGKGPGHGGRTVQKAFDTPADASAFAADAVRAKLAEGYVHAPGAPAPKPEPAPPTAPVAPAAPAAPTHAPRRSARRRAAPAPFVPDSPPASRKRARPAKQAPPAARRGPARKRARKTKQGLRGAAAVDTSAPLGVVDPASGLEGAIYCEHSDAQPVVYDVMLVLVDTAKRHDKFIVLQLIDQGDEQQYVFYERWGRTGTSGQSLKVTYEHAELEKALNDFADKFQQKTGLAWDDRDEQPVQDKYRFVVQDFDAKYHAVADPNPTWQYWVDDSVDGKSTGWYNYDDFGNHLAEQLYNEFLSNSWLTERVVASGMYSYLVNLESMTQTNVVHPAHTIRHIRRVPPNEVADDTSPTDDFPATTVAAVQVPPINLRAKKPNVPVTKVKPPHKVEPAPSAVVSSTVATATKPADDEPPTGQDEEPVEIPVDDACPDAEDYQVVDDWDATMNQSNIMAGNNNNKYYKIQLLQHQQKETYHVWTRWGRVGESRGTQTKLMGPYTVFDKAESAFGKKFRDKTGNFWANRDNFEAIPGKYELLQIDHTARNEEDVEPLIVNISSAEAKVEYLPSKLVKETKELIQLLFKKDVYTDAMKEFEIDIRRMPLGNLSREQIERGVAVLEEIEDSITKVPAVPKSDLERLSSKFYTTLPHDFGRRRPPVIADVIMLQRSYDMCNVLLDIEKATTLMSEAEEKTAKHEEKKKVPHPADAQYDSLNAELRLVQPGSEEYDVVVAAFENTKGCYANSKLLNIWRVERRGEASRFKKLNLANHALLWHGSHIGAISAILSTGLRIMPHSGGRVGRGIYLASENGKSQQYTTPASRSNVGCMFLAEAALGKTCEILEDDSSLVAPPNGYDSVRACGRQTPGGFKTMKLDDVPVQVPVESPSPFPKAKHSTFSQDEYLIYNEAQARIRYVITVKTA